MREKVQEVMIQCFRCIIVSLFGSGPGLRYVTTLYHSSMLLTVFEVGSETRQLEENQTGICPCKRQSHEARVLWVAARALLNNWLFCVNWRMERRTTGPEQKAFRQTRL